LRVLLLILGDSQGVAFRHLLAPPSDGGQLPLRAFGHNRKLSRVDRTLVPIQGDELALYLRLLVIFLLFNRPLAAALAPILFGPALLGLIMAGGWHWIQHGTRLSEEVACQPPVNPLELGAAAAFAVLFIAVSRAASWAQSRYGVAGIYGLAAVVGVTDIDPFVLILAQHSTGQTAGERRGFRGYLSHMFKQHDQGGLRPRLFRRPHWHHACGDPGGACRI
jgi:Domain of unknown function (DUF4010)